MIRLLLTPLLLLPLLGCVSTGVRNVEITPSKTLDSQIGSELTLLFPSGDVQIDSSEDDQLHVVVKFFCNAESETCPENAAKAGIVHTQSGEHSTLSFEPSSAYTARHADLRFRIRVPEVRQLNVDMDAGALRLASRNGCVNVSGGAGEVTITAPAATVASVSLDANIGDASLKTPAGAVFDERKLLVGSEVLWEEGKGSCNLRAKLQAGSLDVELTAPR
jgi:hypothetical protein